MLGDGRTANREGEICVGIWIMLFDYSPTSV